MVCVCVCRLQWRETSSNKIKGALSMLEIVQALPGIDIYICVCVCVCVLIIYRSLSLSLCVCVCVCTDLAAPLRFIIVAKGRCMDLEAKSIGIKNKWIEALQFVIVHLDDIVWFWLIFLTMNICKKKKIVFYYYLVLLLLLFLCVCLILYKKKHCFLY